MNIIEAIKELDSNAKVSVGNDNIDQIRWHDGNPNNLTDSQILAKRDELIIEYDAQEYARDRASSYPTWQKQMDMQYWDQVNGTTTWKDACEAVKLKFPKP